MNNPESKPLREASHWGPRNSVKLRLGDPPGAQSKYQGKPPRAPCRGRGKGAALKPPRPQGCLQGETCEPEPHLLGLIRA